MEGHSGWKQGTPTHKKPPWQFCYLCFICNLLLLLHLHLLWSLFLYVRKAFSISTSLHSLISHVQYKICINLIPSICYNTWSQHIWIWEYVCLIHRILDDVRISSSYMWNWLLSTRSCTQLLKTDTVAIKKAVHSSWSLGPEKAVITTFLLTRLIRQLRLWWAKGELTMSVIGMGIMWAFAFVFFAIITRWRMGRTSDERTAYWAKYEGK